MSNSHKYISPTLHASIITFTAHIPAAACQHLQLDNPDPVDRLPLRPSSLSVISQPAKRQQRSQELNSDIRHFSIVISDKELKCNQWLHIWSLVAKAYYWTYSEKETLSWEQYQWSSKQYSELSRWSNTQGNILLSYFIYPDNR